jgi:hypothetical protein
MVKKHYLLIGNSIIFLGFILLLLSFLMKVEPSLTYFINQPFFSNTSDFLRPYLLSPKGISNYISLFLFQYYEQESLAKILIIIQLALFGLLIFQLFKKIVPLVFITIPVILISVPLMMEQSYYLIYPEVLMVCILSIGLVLLYQKLEKNIVYDYAIFLLITSITFYVTGIFGQLLFLSAILPFSFYKKQYLRISIYLIIALIPITGWFLFDQNFSSLMEVSEDNFFIKNPTISQQLINFLPAFIFILLMVSRYLKSFFDKRSVTNWIIIIPFVVVLPLSYWSAFKVAFVPEMKKAIQIDKMAYDQDWDKLLNIKDFQTLNNPFVMSHVYRALFHKGILLDYLFYYPTIFNENALIVKEPSDISIAAPMMEIYYEMGFISEARHWANEIVTASSYHPFILKRLVESYLISGQYKTAEKYLNLLETSPKTKDWAKGHRKYLYCDPCIESDIVYGKYRKLNPKNDFFAVSNDPYTNLSRLMNDSLPSKMAFEYYIAYELFMKNPQTVLHEMNRFRKYGYSRLPLACQEAVLIYKAINGIKTVGDLLGYQYDQKVLDNFDQFTTILFDQFDGKIDKARSSLKPYNKTYWYYYLYSKSPEAGKTSSN